MIVDRPDERMQPPGALHPARVDRPDERMQPPAAPHPARESRRRLAGQISRRVLSIPEENPRLAAGFGFEGLFHTLMIHLVTVYSSTFALRLGADDGQLGLLNGLPQFFGLLVLLPGTLLMTRRKNVRKAAELALLICGTFYGLAAFAPLAGSRSVIALILCMSAAQGGLVLYNTAWQDFFSNVVPVRQRNSVYSLRTALGFLAGIVAIIVMGLVLARASSDRQRIFLYQVFYGLALITTLIQWMILRRLPSDPTTRHRQGWHELRAAARGMWLDRRFRAFAVTAVFFHIGLYLGWPLFTITQIKYIGADEAWYGYGQVAATVLLWLTVRPWSRYIERHGVRNALIIGAFGLALNPLFTILPMAFSQPLSLTMLVVCSLGNSVTYSAFQLSFLQCLLEVVPTQHKNLILALFTSTLLVFNALMPLVGIRIYELLGSSALALILTMVITSVWRLIGTIFFWLRWRRLRHEPDSGVNELLGPSR